MIDAMIDAMKHALGALELNLPVIEDYGDKEQLLRQHNAITALRTAIAEAEKQDRDWLIRSIKQEAETGLVVGDKVGMRDALQQILREADKHLGIEV